MKDVAGEIGLERVGQVVADFYAAVREHPTLKTPFARVTDWEHHERILTHFWWGTLGGARYMEYQYRVAERHMTAGFTPALLEDWHGLFAGIVQASLPAELAEAWLERARNIGTSLVMMHGWHTSQT
ncbi:group III truncated hemoglobin [Niveibacterium sp. SC-1]|uniref:group III truncated hemoglobin n=1 Tax=Niveibacterium sp. SC-1 TaxID=3135646 RepID=UPI00311FD439